MSGTTMADLKPGTRIRHIAWDLTGTVRVMGGRSEVRWDDVFGEIEISDEGVVYPQDVEIIKETPDA